MAFFSVNWIAATVVAGWAAAQTDAGAEASDGVLLRQIAGGDAEAFSAIYDRHSRPVFALLLRMCRDRGHAEDLLQEVFLTLWRRAGDYDAKATSALPWLLVIARNRALDRIRSATARREQMQDDAGMELATAPLARAASERQAGQFWREHAMGAIQKALAGLSGPERQVVELAYFEGLTQTEISERLTTPLGTVKTWTRSGLAKLRSALDPDLGG